MLLDDLTGPAPAWSEAHHKRLDALFGFRVADLPWNRPTRFSQAVLGDFDAIGAAEVADIPADERHAWAIARLIEAIGAEVARLGEHRAAIDPARIAEDRADAVALGRLDPGKEGALAQRYIAAAARDLSRALRDLHLVESRYGTDADADRRRPTPIIAAEADSAPERSPDPVAEEPVAASVASFGGSSSAVPVAAAAAGMTTPDRDIWPGDAAEIAIFPVEFMMIPAGTTGA